MKKQDMSKPVFVLSKCHLKEDACGHNDSILPSPIISVTQKSLIEVSMIEMSFQEHVILYPRSGFRKSDVAARENKDWA